MSDHKLKPTYPQLALLEWLVERPNKRFYIVDTGISATSAVTLYESGGLDEEGKHKLLRVYPHRGGGMLDDAARTLEREANLAMLKRLGGKDTIQNHPMHKLGFFKTYYCNRNREEYDRFTGQFQKTHWQWSEQIHVATKKAFEYWENEGKAIFEAMKAKLDAEKASVERLVIVGKQVKITPKLPKDLYDKVPAEFRYRLPLPPTLALKPQAIVRVVKETDTRLYVDDVQRLGENSFSDGSVVDGREPRLYVLRENVILDNADEVIARKLTAIHQEHMDDIDRISIQLVEEMLPMLIRLDQRLKQKTSERDDMFSEAIESFKNGGSSNKP